jgi:hypothetical protein
MSGGNLDINGEGDIAIIPGPLVIPVSDWEIQDQRARDLPMVTQKVSDLTLHLLVFPFSGLCLLMPMTLNGF